MANTIDVKNALGVTITVATSDAVKASVDAVKTSTDTAVAALGTLDGSVDAVKAAVDLVVAALVAGSVASLGAKTVANSPAVNIASDQPAIPVAPASSAADVKQTFTRQNNVTGYLANQVVGALVATMTFAGLGKAGGASIIITSARMKINVDAAPATQFRLHLYSSTPPSAPADAAAFDVTVADDAVYLGYIEFPTPTDIGTFVASEVNNIGKQIRATSADVYGVLQTVAAFTPVAQSVYQIELHRAEV